MDRQYPNLYGLPPPGIPHLMPQRPSSPAPSSNCSGPYNRHQGLPMPQPTYQYPLYMCSGGPPVTSLEASVPPPNFYRMSFNPRFYSNPPSVSSNMMAASYQHREQHQVQQVTMPMYVTTTGYPVGMVPDMRTMDWVQAASPTQSSDCGQELTTTSVSGDLSDISDESHGLEILTGVDHNHNISGNCSISAVPVEMKARKSEKAGSTCDELFEEKLRHHGINTGPTKADFSGSNSSPTATLATAAAAVICTKSVTECDDRGGSGDSFHTVLEDNACLEIPGNNDVFIEPDSADQHSAQSYTNDDIIIESASSSSSASSPVSAEEKSALIASLKYVIPISPASVTALQQSSSTTGLSSATDTSRAMGNNADAAIGACDGNGDANRIDSYSATEQASAITAAVACQADVTSADTSSVADDEAAAFTNSGKKTNSNAVDNSAENNCITSGNTVTLGNISITSGNTDAVGEVDSMKSVDPASATSAGHIFALAAAAAVTASASTTAISNASTSVIENATNAAGNDHVMATIATANACENVYSIDKSACEVVPSVCAAATLDANIVATNATALAIIAATAAITTADSIPPFYSPQRNGSGVGSQTDSDLSTYTERYTQTDPMRPRTVMMKDAVVLTEQAVLWNVCTQTDFICVCQHLPTATLEPNKTMNARESKNADAGFSQVLDQVLQSALNMMTSSTDSLTPIATAVSASALDHVTVATGIGPDALQTDDSMECIDDDEDEAVMRYLRERTQKLDHTASNIGHLSPGGKLDSVKLVTDGQSGSVSGNQGSAGNVSVHQDLIGNVPVDQGLVSTQSIPVAPGPHGLSQPNITGAQIITGGLDNAMQAGSIDLAQRVAAVELATSAAANTNAVIPGLHSGFTSLSTDLDRSTNGVSDINEVLGISGTDLGKISSMASELKKLTPAQAGIACGQRGILQAGLAGGQQTIGAGLSKLDSYKIQCLQSVPALLHNPELLEKIALEQLCAAELQEQQQQLLQQQRLLLLQQPIQQQLQLQQLQQFEQQQPLQLQLQFLQHEHLQQQQVQDCLAQVQRQQQSLALMQSLDSLSTTSAATSLAATPHPHTIPPGFSGEEFYEATRAHSGISISSHTSSAVHEFGALDDGGIRLDHRASGTGSYPSPGGILSIGTLERHLGGGSEYDVRRDMPVGRGRCSSGVDRSTSSSDQSPSSTSLIIPRGRGGRPASGYDLNMGADVRNVVAVENSVVQTTGSMRISGMEPYHTGIGVESQYMGIGAESLNMGVGAEYNQMGIREARSHYMGISGAESQNMRIGRVPSHNVGISGVESNQIDVGEAGFAQTEVSECSAVSSMSGLIDKWSTQRCEQSAVPVKQTKTFMLPRAPTLGRQLNRSSEACKELQPPVPDGNRDLYKIATLKSGSGHGIGSVEVSNKAQSDAMAGLYNNVVKVKPATDQSVGLQESSNKPDSTPMGSFTPIDAASQNKPFGRSSVSSTNTLGSGSSHALCHQSVTSPTALAGENWPQSGPASAVVKSFTGHTSGGDLSSILAATAEQWIASKTGKMIEGASSGQQTGSAVQKIGLASNNEQQRGQSIAYGDQKWDQANSSVQQRSQVSGFAQERGLTSNVSQQRDQASGYNQEKNITNNYEEQRGQNSRSEVAGGQACGFDDKKAQTIRSETQKSETSSQQRSSDYRQQRDRSGPRNEGSQKSNSSGGHRDQRCLAEMGYVGEEVWDSTRNVEVMSTFEPDPSFYSTKTDRGKKKVKRTQYYE